MKLTTPKRTIEVTLPRLTLRNESMLRQWYSRLQDIAREHTLTGDVLARLLVEARKRDYDLSHIITSNGSLTEYAQQHDAEELRDVILDIIGGDVELIKLLISIQHYPRTQQAYLTGVEFLREVCGVTLDDDELQETPFDEVAQIIEEFFRHMQ
jgi:hypothetical protein